MAPLTLLGSVASRLLNMFVSSSPGLDLSCAGLAMGRRPCVIAAALVNLASSLAPPGSFSNQELGHLGAAAILISVWFNDPDRAPRLPAITWGGQTPPALGFVELSAVAQGAL